MNHCYDYGTNPVDFLNVIASHCHRLLIQFLMFCLNFISEVLRNTKSSGLVLFI